MHDLISLHSIESLLSVTSNGMNSACQVSLLSLYRMDGGGGSEKEEVPGGKAVSLRRSARVASNSRIRSASSVSSSVEGGGGGASEGEGGKGKGAVEVRGVEVEVREVHQVGSPPPPHPWSPLPPSPLHLHQPSSVGDRTGR